MLGNNQQLNESFQVAMGFISFLFVSFGFIALCDITINRVCKRFQNNREITIYVPDEGVSTSVKVRPDFFELQLPKNRGHVSPPKFIDSPV